MKKVVLKDDHGKSLEVDLMQFLNHLNEYHQTGTSYIPRVAVHLQLMKNLGKK